MTRAFLLLALLLVSVGVALGQNTTAYTNTSTTSVPYNESDNTGNNGPDDWWAPVVVTIQAGSCFTGTRSAPVFVNGHQLGTISSGVSLTATLSRNITADPSNGYYSSYALQNNGNTVYSGVISVIAAGYEGDCNYTYSCASSASQNGHDFNYFPDPVNVTVTLNYPGGQYHLVINFSNLPPAWFWGREIELCLLYLGYLIACIRLIGSYLT